MNAEQPEPAVKVCQSRFAGVEGELEFGQRVLHDSQTVVCVICSSTQHHKVVSISNHRYASTTERCIQLVQCDVAKKRGERSSLKNSDTFGP